MFVGFLWAFWHAAPALSAIPQHQGDLSREACIACHLQGVNAPLMPHRDLGRFRCAIWRGDGGEWSNTVTARRLARRTVDDG